MDLQDLINSLPRDYYTDETVNCLNSLRNGVGIYESNMTSPGGCYNHFKCPLKGKYRGSSYCNKKLFELVKKGEK